MALPEVPSFAATGVGSLPGDDVERAVDAVLQHAPELPYAPQLPNRSPYERMVPQTAEGLPGIVLEHEHGWAFVQGISIPGTGMIPDLGEPVLSERAHPGLYALLRRVEGRGIAVKVQLTGPVTVASHTTDGRGRRAIYDPGWRRAAAQGIGQKGALAARLVREAGCEPVVVLDEPSLFMATGALAALTPGGAAGLVAEALEAIDAPRGVHSCGKADWSLLFDLPADVVGFDAYSDGEDAVGSGAVERFVGRGGTVAWGIVPASGAAVDETAPGLVGRLRYHLNKLEAAGVASEQASAASLISPSCGLGGLTPSVAERVFELLGQVTAALRAPASG